MNVNLVNVIESLANTYGIQIDELTIQDKEKFSQFAMPVLSDMNMNSDNALEILFKATKPQNILSLTTPLGLHYASFFLPQDNEHLFFMGPWRCAEPSEEAMERLESIYGKDFKDVLYRFCLKAPCISFKNLDAICSVLSLPDPSCPYRIVDKKSSDLGDPIRLEKIKDCSILLDRFHSEMIMEQYRLESDFISCVAFGNTREASCLLDELKASILSQNYQSSVSSLRKMLHRYNTLFSGAVANSNVHPSYVYQVYESFEETIDASARGIAPALNCMMDMISDYCSVVRTHSLKNYTPLIQTAINYINLNIDEPLSLNIVAKKCHISSSYLSSLFKKETGKTLTDYIAGKRIEMAQMKLRWDNDSITSIASQVGFSDINYFTRTFKKTTGITPSAYRESFRTHFN